jgi:MYXO-CTERM domain-containing protein
MQSSSRVGWLAWLRVIACVVAVLLVAGSAAAWGRVEWKTKTLKARSDNNAWNIELKIYLNRAPDFANMPVKFEFQPTVYYERAMVDGDKLIERKVPLVGREPLIESVDIGFLDPGSGQIQKRTRFSFKITRGHGFECGEYRVTIRDGRNGQILGTPVNVVLGGENEVIDRRSIVFTGERKKDKNKDKDKASDSGDAASEDADKADEQKDESAQETAPAEAEPAEEEPGPEADAPPPVEGKPGGCGCRLGAAAPSSTALGGLLALGALLALGRRRDR